MAMVSSIEKRCIRSFNNKSYTQQEFQERFAKMIIDECLWLLGHVEIRDSILFQFGINDDDD